MKLRMLATAAIVVALTASSQTAWAAPLKFTPDPTKSTVNIEASIPLASFNGVKLPRGAVQLEDGMLSVTIVPEWNFDKVPVLSGPILRVDVGTANNQGVISGVVLFEEGFWYDKYWNANQLDTIVTASGTTAGRISSFTPTQLSVTMPAGNIVSIALTDIREIHSARAFAFAIPTTSAAAISPETSWTGNAATVRFTPTGASPSGRLLARDPLLKGDGDWSTGRLVALGTVLSLAEIAQFVPELVLPLNSRHLYKVAQQRSYQAALNGITAGDVIPPPPPGLFP
jgi:hypothetical protein